MLLKIKISLLLFITAFNMAAIPIHVKSVSKMKLQYFNEKLSSDTMQLKNKIAIIDTLIREAQHSGNSNEEIDLLKKKGDLYFDNGIYNTSANIYNQVLKEIEKKETSYNFGAIKFDILYRLGKVYYFLGKYDDGVSCMYELLKRNDSKKKDYDIKAYTLLSDMFVRLNKPDIAKKHLNEALKLLNSINRQDSVYTDGKYDIYTSYSSVYLLKQDYDTSLRYLEKAREFCNNDVNKLTKIYQNLAIIYININEYHIAEEYLLKALSTGTLPYVRSVISNNLAILYYMQEKYTQALDVCNRNLRLVDQINATHVKSNLYSILSNIYTEKGDYKKALEFKNKEREVLDSIFDQESEQRILLLNNDFEKYKIERDNKILEYKVQLAELSSFKKNVIILSLIILFLVISTLIFIILRKSIRQNKANKDLQQQLLEMDENKQEIIDSSQKQFETEMSQKTRELTANTMFVAKMCDVAAKVSDDVSKLEPYCHNAESRAILQEMTKSLNSLSIEEKGWDDFKLYFEQIHQSFFTRLNAAHPWLTPGENRMCAFIVMNLSTKEIATLTNRTIRTVDTTKFRIRKKLNIPRDISTNTYLRQFISE